jgi:glycosyltransferase involved in cell wall biosynthesis
MRNKKKLVFVLPSLVAGGAERVMSFIADNISKDNFEVTLWIAGYEKNTKYIVDNASVVYFNKPRVLKAIPDFYMALKNNKPDIVISSIAHLNITMAILSIFFPKTKFIGREASVLSVKKEFSKKRNSIRLPSLLKLAYRYLDLIICQSRDMYDDMHSNFNIPAHKMRIINNPITDNFKLKEDRKNQIVSFITVASLKEQKGHERIIRSISKLKIPYTYTIVGDGSEKKKLFELIDNLGITDNVTHIPYTKDVAKHLAESDFFLQGSYVEGFPNCLIESCSVGVPIIAYNAPGGLNEIIIEGLNGYISQNDKDFLNNITKATQNASWNPEKIRDSVHVKFNKEKILEEYEQLFIDILK